VTEERRGNGVHHSVHAEKLCFGMDKAMNPLGKGLALGGTACHPMKRVSKSYFLPRRNCVNTFLAGWYLFELPLWWEQAPTSDFKKNSSRSILSLKQTPEDNRN